MDDFSWDPECTAHGDTVVIGEETPAGIALGGTAAVPAAPAAPSISPVVSVENTLLCELSESIQS